MNRFALSQDITVGVEEGDDTGVLPEIYRKILESGQIRAIFGDACTLSMPDAHLLENISQPVQYQKSFVAATGIDTRLRSRIVAEVTHRQAIDMIFKCALPVPECAATGVPHRVADQYFILTISVSIERKRVMSCICFPLPDLLQIAIKYPEIIVPVLDQDVATSPVT